MPRFCRADDAAIWGEGELETYAALGPSLAAPPSSLARDSSTPAILAALNQIQVLTEALCETRLDPMQQELVGFLADAGGILRQEICGELRAAPMPRPNVDDELDIEEVELIDDLGPPLETSAADQDYLDYELDDDLHIEPVAPAIAPENLILEIEAEAALLDDLEIIDNEEAAAAQLQSLAPGPLDQLRILIADDNAAHQTAARVLLEGLGARCNVCNCSSVAELARVSGWDAILIDPLSNARSGISSLRSIRADEEVGQKRRTPIFTMAANCRPDQIRECMAAGADGHVTKPLSKAVIAEQFEVVALERLLDVRT